MALLKWDQRFTGIAKLAAGWSKDPNAKVEAVLVDTHGQVAGVGFNGFPKMVEDSVERLSSEIKLALVVHAEVNAILGAGERARAARSKRDALHAISAEVTEVRLTSGRLKSPERFLPAAICSS